MSIWICYHFSSTRHFCTHRFSSRYNWISWMGWYGCRSFFRLFWMFQVIYRILSYLANSIVYFLERLRTLTMQMAASNWLQEPLWCLLNKSLQYNSAAVLFVAFIKLNFWTWKYWYFLLGRMRLGVIPIGNRCFYSFPLWFQGFRRNAIASISVSLL